MNKVLLKHEHAHFFHIVYGCFAPQWLNLIVETDIVWLTKPNIFTTWPLAEACQLPL